MDFTAVVTNMINELFQTCMPFFFASNLILDAYKLTDNYCVWRHNLPCGFQVLWEQHVLCFLLYKLCPLIRLVFFLPNWTGLMR